MRRTSTRIPLFGLALAALLAGACAPPPPVPTPAPLAPRQRHWAVAAAPVYADWWAKTEACAGRRGRLEEVAFYAVDATHGQIYLGNQRAQGWWVREGNRIYLPVSGLFDEWLVRHEMLHALTQQAHHDNDQFVRRCHVASALTWADSSLARDPENPRGL